MDNSISSLLILDKIHISFCKFNFKSIFGYLPCSIFYNGTIWAYYIVYYRVV